MVLYGIVPCHVVNMKRMSASWPRKENYTNIIRQDAVTGGVPWFGIGMCTFCGFIFVSISLNFYACLLRTWYNTPDKEPHR